MKTLLKNLIRKSGFIEINDELDNLKLSELLKLISLLENNIL